MAKILISLSYKLEASVFYKKLKTFTYNILENSSYEYKKYFDFMMIFLVLSTIGILIFEVNHDNLGILDVYKTFAIFIFVCEYLGRLWICCDAHSIIIEDYENSEILNKKYKISQSIFKIISKKFDFILSPMAIIDLLAILPYYRPLRILRIFMIFRLFKLLRYSNSLKEFLTVFKERKFELFTLALMYVTVVSFAATIMYVYEGPKGVNENVEDFFDAIYWSIITISTVGYGDVTPVTLWGKVVTLILIISGFLVIAFGTSIITTGLSDKMDSIKEDRIQAEASKMKDFIIICGFGKMGLYLCRELVKLGSKFIIIDNNKDRVEYAKSLNYLAVCADCTNMDTLENLGVNKGANSVIILTQNDAVNLSTVLSARALNSDINIISRVNQSISKYKFHIAGVNKSIIFNDSTAFVATQYVQKPVAFEAIDGILLNKENEGIIDEIEVVSNSDVINKDINKIKFHKYGLTLVGITNSKDLSDFIFNPLYKDYKLKQNDILIVIGHKLSISQLRTDLINNSLRG